MTQYGDWQEFYASTLELNVWTGCNVTKIVQNEADNSWTVNVTRADGSNRELTPRHIVFAHGTGGGVPKMPEFPGMVCIAFIYDE
jgi:cation diffusion facilitator CzcD-associated flavoprotein CzcO